MAAPGLQAPAAAAAPNTTDKQADAVVVTYVEVERGWVEKSMAAPPPPPRGWAAEPANARYVLPLTRHILIRVDADAPATQQAAARKKADLVLARIVKGEDFAKVAREVSEDPGSKDKGGAYPGDMVEHFVEPYRAAYAALASGAFTKALVKTSFGWHVIKKEAPDEAAILAGHRRWSALQLARRLSGEIADRLKPARAEAAATNVVDTTILALLGGPASTDHSRPQVRLVPVAKVASPPPNRMCAQLVSTPRDTVSLITLDAESGFVVVKAGADKDVDETARPTAAIDSDDAAWSYCHAERDDAAKLTPAMIEKMIKDAKRKQEQRN